MTDDRTFPGRPNIAILVMALVLSIVLWAVVTTQEVTTTRDVMVGVLYNNVDRSKIALRQPPEQVIVHVSGPAEALKQLVDGKETGTVDLRDAPPGRRTYTVALPPNLRDIAVPNGFAHVNLDIEPVVRIADFPVETGTSGRLSDPSVILLNRDVFPHKITITGPKSAAARVSHAIVTVDLAKVHPDDQAPYDGYVELYDSKGAQLNLEELSLDVDPPSVKVRLSFMAAPVQRPAFIGVPPFIGHPANGYRADGYTVTPDSVMISGSSIALSRTVQVQTEPIDLSGLSASHQFVVKVVLPPGVTSATPKVVKVRVSVRPVP